MGTDTLTDRKFSESERFIPDEEDERSEPEEELVERLQQALGKTRQEIRRMTDPSLTLSGRQDWRDDP